MATIKSYNENLTLDADGTGSDLIFKSNGSQVGSLTDAGLLSATTFSGSGASLTSLPAAALSGSPTFTTVTATTFSGSGASLTSLPAAALSGSPTFTTLNATTVDLGNWTVTESVGVLYFATGGVNKMKLDASGNLTVVGDLTAFGTI
jgi:hypothetical protein